MNLGFFSQWFLAAGGYSLILTTFTMLLLSTDVARNFDWRGPKIEKFCDVILMTFFGDVMAITH